MPTNLTDAIFWVAVVACAVAQIFILRAVFRVTPAGVVPGSAASSTPEGEQVSVPKPHRLTEIVWVVLPVVLLVLAFVLAWRTMHPPAATLPDWLPPGAEIIRR